MLYNTVIYFFYEMGKTTWKNPWKAIPKIKQTVDVLWNENAHSFFKKVGKIFVTSIKFSVPRKVEISRLKSKKMGGRIVLFNLTDHRIFSEYLGHGKLNLYLAQNTENLPAECILFP